MKDKKPSLESKPVIVQLGRTTPPPTNNLKPQVVVRPTSDNPN